MYIHVYYDNFSNEKKKKGCRVYRKLYEHAMS
jgi:hypothetical protein